MQTPLGLHATVVRDADALCFVRAQVHVDIESVSSRESAQRWGEEALWLVMLYTYDANIFAS